MLHSSASAAEAMLKAYAAMLHAAVMLGTRGYGHWPDAAASCALAATLFPTRISSKHCNAV